jgi:16S rRNA (guanine966-N2)-methyltransferase
VYPDLPDARVVDLFAGSGALGLEALSRGAAWADFIENDPRTVRVLRQNIESLGAGECCAVHRVDAFAFVDRLASRGEGEPYDVAFADPPWRHLLATSLAERWLAKPFAAIFGVEHESSERLPDGGDTRRYGDSAITIYRT